MRLSGSRHRTTEYVQEGEGLQAAQETFYERQSVRLSERSRQRLLGYAESFLELADSLAADSGQDTNTGDRYHILEKKRILESRQLLRHHITEVAEIMEQAAAGEFCYEPMDGKREKMLRHLLRTQRISLEDPCYLFREDRGKAVGMVLYTDRRGGVSAEEVAELFSTVFHCRMEPFAGSPYIVDGTPRNFLFVEEPRFTALVGASRATKETERCSGDNYSVIQTETGRKIILLSDGTGSGEQAGRSSSDVLDLMEKMLESGFAPERAVRMVNTTFYAKGEETNHPTLDLCRFDLYTGECEICKLGGAVTFLLRGRTVERISGKNFPLGILQDAKVDLQKFPLGDGDYLVFLTDGVPDTQIDREEEWLEDALRRQPSRNPQEMAERLLQRAIHNCGGHIQDDMTVLVLGIWEN